MDCRHEESTSTNLGTSSPLPPPLPSHLTTRFCRKGLMITDSSRKELRYAPNSVNNSLDRLFDEGYRADVLVLTDDGGIIYAHASVLGVASPVFRGMLKQVKGRNRSHKRTISIPGVSSDAVRVFIRFLYSSCYEEENMKEFVMPLLVLSHVYVVPTLKQVCESWLEGKLMTTENAIDIFQLAMLCDVPRLSLISHRFILSNFKAVSISEGWNCMKESHPVLENEVLKSKKYEEVQQKEHTRKMNERKIYVQLYEAMEALVHICRDGCRTIGPHDKILREDKEPCPYVTCKGLESLIRHFAGCKNRGSGGCIHCKRVWQILDLHSRLCANSDNCRVPLCKNFKLKRKNQSKKEDIRWRMLVKKIVRSNSVTGAPFFSLESV